MSQAGFGDSSPQGDMNPLFPEPQSHSQGVSASTIGEPTTVFNALPRQVLEQELQFCNERSQQAQVLLRQAQEQLQLSQLVIQRQETLTQTLQSRIDHLERELEDVHTNCDELRDRLKRQQHHTSQLKAALERCLDTSTHAPKELVSNDIALSALESWSVAKLADEKISPIEAINDSPLQNVVKILPTPQPIDLPATQGQETLRTPVQEPETIVEPIQLSTAAKTQPISPLIVRPHRAMQGSTITPEVNSKSNNKLQPINLAEAQNNELQSIDSQSPDVQTARHEISQNQSDFATSNESRLASTWSVKNVPLLSTVVAPKFIQELYANGSANSTAYEETATPMQLAIANSPSTRKAVTSLAAVQLPQFPPLPRR